MPGFLSISDCRVFGQQSTQRPELFLLGNTQRLDQSDQYSAQIFENQNTAGASDGRGENGPNSNQKGELMFIPPLNFNL